MKYSKQFLKKLDESISDIIEGDSNKINEPTKYVADKISKWIVNEDDSASDAFIGINNETVKKELRDIGQIS